MRLKILLLKTMTPMTERSKLFLEEHKKQYSQRKELNGSFFFYVFFPKSLQYMETKKLQKEEVR